MDQARKLLNNASIASSIFALRPDYRAGLVIVHGITPGASSDSSEALLKDAEASARERLAETSVTEIPHIAAWREAYKSFGAKPNKFRNSLEALTRRVNQDNGLPRVNRLTDIYNALSVKHQIPLGGEDLSKYEGPPRLIRATGDEEFIVKSGTTVTKERPDVGEIVWADDFGITCRRWNWRQGPRTALTDETTTALFICDALYPMTDEELDKVIDELVEHLKQLGPNVVIERRILRASSE